MRRCPECDEVVRPIRDTFYNVTRMICPKCGWDMGPARPPATPAKKETA